MSGSTFLLLVRLAFSLSLVFGLMWVAAKVMRGRNGGMKRLRADHLEVVERKALTKNSSIAIVRVGDETLTVGITDNTVTLLGHADLEAAKLDTANNETAADEIIVTESIPTAAIPTRAIGASAAVGRGTVDLRTGSRRGVLDVLRDKTVRHIPG